MIDQRLVAPLKSLDDFLATLHDCSEEDICRAVIEVARGPRRKALRAHAMAWRPTPNYSFHRTLKEIILEVTEPPNVKLNPKKTWRAMLKFVDGETLVDREWEALAWLTMIDKNDCEFGPDNTRWAADKSERAENITYYQEIRTGVERLQAGGLN